MVHYINYGKQNRFKRYIAIGAAAAVLACAGLAYNNDSVRPRVQAALGINSRKSLEYRIGRLKEDLKEYPDVADSLIVSGIKAKRESGGKFSSDCYYEMFGVMKEKFEQKPELLDYLGPNAIGYQEGRLPRKYKKGIDDIYQSLKKKAIETKDRIKGMLE